MIIAFLVMGMRCWYYRNDASVLLSPRRIAPVTIDIRENLKLDKLSSLLYNSVEIDNKE